MASRRPILPSIANAIVTAGAKCASDPPSMVIGTTSIAAVASGLPGNATAMLPPDSVSPHDRYP
jgi:hypothetical protein